MRRFFFQTAFIWALFFLACTGRSADAYQPKKTAGPHKVEVVRYDWKDAKRDREVPVKIYYPKDVTNACPVIVFSHGLGGTREGYEYLGQHWASHGYISVHLQHHGSDDAVWRGNANPMQSMKRATLDIRNSLNRPLDVSFVVDELERLNADKSSMWKGRFDLQKLGMAGHSFGAYTTLAIGGERFLVMGEEKTLADKRFKALIPMCSPVPPRNRDQAFSNIKLPCLHMTGTKDVSPINETTAEERRIPFDKMPGPDNFLINFNGADHMVFSGRSGFRGDRSKDSVFHEYILMSSTAFWDAYLLDDQAAKVWFKGGGFKKALGDNGIFEMFKPDQKAVSQN